MCGIYAVLSAQDVAPGPGDEFFRNLDTLLSDGHSEALTTVLSDESACARVLEELRAVKASAELWTRRGGCLAILADPELRSRFEVAIARLRTWVSDLEALVESGVAAVRERLEAVNLLVVVGKDVAWQIEQDVLESAVSVEQLAGSDDPHVIARAWELNLVLRSLDRLEVRGRDSAGIVAYVRFRGPADLESFLDGPIGGRAWRREVESRKRPQLVDGSVIRPSGCGNVLLFAFKVASEVGKMGDNATTLRSRIVGDRLFQALLREHDVTIQSLAHTRWASNGIISPANCHPVDSTLQRGNATEEGSVGRFVAVLNGDIDNYRALVDKHVTSRGLTIDPAVTTDAKIIPVVVAYHLESCRDLETAFRRAFDEFEGSMAIGLMAADRPGELLFGQKGSGQGLFFGVGDETVAVASEMYGVVELTSAYAKAECECDKSGEIFRLRAESGRVSLDLLGEDGFSTVGDERRYEAEITTRDINRSGFPHFFLKEITESVESVSKTIRGKFDFAGSGEVRSRLGADTIPLGLVNGLREGRVRHVAVIGQGTAAVAAQGVAHLLERALRDLPHPVAVFAQKATEFSAHGLRDEMADTLVVAVSQSGTTTDTNRTVDLARQRGAWVLGIVNRRNSDLVYKSHAVLYTSDGRDIEMSVASTKAFYAQNVAGQVLALSLASVLGTMSSQELRDAVGDLHELPRVLQQTLDLQDQIATLARRHALRRRHWAVVGSGSSKIAADEIRIKLSELCYKSIAVDYLEDKKHIDLSSEPLVIVCVVDLAPEVVSDAVKEVAIFKAHDAIPLVIAEEGQTGFEPYSDGTIYVPACRGMLSFLPATIVGHLFGYHAAAAMDAVADRLRSLRACIISLQEANGFGDEAAAQILDELSASEASTLIELQGALEGGGFDGGLDVHRAVRLSSVLQLCLGRISVDGFGRWKPAGGGVLDTVVSTLSDAVSELSRPIDAIKHQAKTVTVGVSRGEVTEADGPLWTAVRNLGVPSEDLLESHRAFLSMFEPLVATVEGATSYRLTGLDPVGRPGADTRIVVERKLGCARGMESRNETSRPLRGNKWTVVKIRDLFLGHGGADSRRILIVPFVGESEEGHLAVVHLELKDSGEREQRLQALAARGGFFARLKGAVTEFDLEWDPALIDSVDNDGLFLGSPEHVAQGLAQARA